MLFVVYNLEVDQESFKERKDNKESFFEKKIFSIFSTEKMTLNVDITDPESV